MSKLRDVVDVRSPSSDSGYSDVAPTFSSMFGRQPGGHLGHLLGHRGGAADQRDRGREPSGRRRTDAPTAAGQFRGLKGSSTPRSASTRRTLSPPSADVKSLSVTSRDDVDDDVKSPTVPKATTSASTSAGGVNVEAFFSLVREGNVDKLRRFVRDTKFDVNTRDTVSQTDPMFRPST